MLYHSLTTDSKKISLMILKCIVEIGKGNGFPVHAFKHRGGADVSLQAFLISSPFVIECM
jgi:hypothetical protein